MIARFTQDWDSVSRFYRIAASREDRDRRLAFLGDTRRSLEEVAFDSLGPDDRIDWIAMRDWLDATIARERQRQVQEEEIVDLVPFADRIAELAHRRRSAERPEGKELAAILDAIRTATETCRNSITDRAPEGASREITQKEKVLALRACKLIVKLRADLEEWATFYRDYDPGITWWIGRPYEALRSALDSYAKRLRSAVLGEQVDGKGEEPVVGDPIGREALLNELAAEWIAYEPEKLIELAEKEWEWCEKERLKAAREMGLGNDWRAALTRINEDYLQPGEQPGLVMDLAREAIAYLKDNDLVTVPELCEATWEMKMMTPERQKVNPYFTGGQTISVSFPTQGMSHEEKLMSLRGNNRHFARATVQHELIPGHHLQMFMSDRYRPYRKIFRTPFFLEGWALYWEIILYEKGFHHTPEGRTGALFWRMHRAARVIFSLRFHLGQMTADEAVAFLEREVGHEHRNAVAEVRRSVSDDYPPLYQAAYLIGGLQMRALRAELVDSGKMEEKAFHDAILQQSYLPIELLQAALRGDSLEKDSRGQWKFD